MNNIKHEDLAGISQHDWYFACYQNNSAVELYNAEYAVVCIESNTGKEITFTNLIELNIWAGY